jgi:hypothetical protein
MEFFERIEQMGHMGKKGSSEKAAQTLSKLATAIADAPDAGDLEANSYLALYKMRVDKAKRAFAKAMHAMANNESSACIDHAERGLFHLQIASIHGHTEVGQLSASEAGAQSFASGGCEESIVQLADAIFRIKLLAEYKNIDPSKDLRRRLSNVVQNLQDAIENYGRGEDTLAFDLAAIGLVWCQYIYARLSGDALCPQKQQAKPLRGLYKLALDAGSAAIDPVSRQTKDGRKKITSLEEYLQSALNAYFEEDQVEMDKFVRLGGIETTSLIRYVARVKTKELVSAMQADKLVETKPNQSFKQISSEIRELIDRHHPEPDQALLALEALHFDVSALRRAMRDEDWQDAQRLIGACRYENDILSREISKMTE